MATNVNLGGNVGPTSGENAISPAGANSVSPLDRAKQIVTGMARSEKDAYWLGLRMENFLKAYEHRIETVAVKDVCDYLERLMRKGQADWQVKQSPDAIGLLMKHGYQREDIGVPQLREAWGIRLNEKVGISVANPTAPNDCHEAPAEPRRGGYFRPKTMIVISSF